MQAARVVTAKHRLTTGQEGVVVRIAATTKLAQAIASVVATDLPGSIRPLESIEAARPTRLAEEAFAAFVARLIILKAIELAVFKCSRPLEAADFTIAVP